MLFEEISIQDKLGRTVVFRNARPEDSADYSRCCKKRGLRTGGARSDGREQGCYCHV